MRLLFKNVPNIKSQTDVKKSVLSNTKAVRRVRFNFSGDGGGYSAQSQRSEDILERERVARSLEN